MSRKKGTSNSPASIISEIVQQHIDGVNVRELAKFYDKPFWIIKNMML